MRPEPESGTSDYIGCGKLRDKTALITGGDSGIGRTVAVLFAKEGGDVPMLHPNGGRVVNGWFGTAGNIVDVGTSISATAIGAAVIPRPIGGRRCNLARAGCDGRGPGVGRSLGIVYWRKKTWTTPMPAASGLPRT
jgi:hypothetical protein